MLAKEKGDSGRAGKQMGNGDRGKAPGWVESFSGELPRLRPPLPLLARCRGARRRRLVSREMATTRPGAGTRNFLSVSNSRVGGGKYSSVWGRGGGECLKRTEKSEEKGGGGGEPGGKRGSWTWGLQGQGAAGSGGLRSKGAALKNGAN